MSNDIELSTVYVFPDGEVYHAAPEWKSDDYEVRKTALCETCDEELTPAYGEPFASCACGTQEWYEEMSEV